MHVLSLRLTFSHNVKGVSKMNGLDLEAHIYMFIATLLSESNAISYFILTFLLSFRSDIMICTTYMEVLCSFKGF